MLFRKNIVSTRTLLQLTVALAFLIGGVGAAFAANNGIAPLLVPYTINTIAGNPLFPSGTTAIQAGYFGEGVPATPTATKNGATLNTPYSMAVDSAGNVYISDTANYIIREVNAQSGLITTIAGITPKSCSGVVCTVRANGCADGVAAAGNPIGTGVRGIAVDAYGNVYFVDSAATTVSVIYRGGAQVAAFITLEDPGGVAKSGGTVQPGYVYHVAGTQDLGTCAGTSGNTDNVLAFQNGTLKNPQNLFLDSAGNIYIGDIGNLTVRVINTQATPQTFFQYTVAPGFIRSITNCSALLTVPCPTATTTSTANTGINGPVNAIVYNTQYKAGEVDAYGNIYQLNGTGSGTGPPGIYSATAYAGGAPLTNLIIAEAPLLNASYGPAAGNAPAILNAQGLPTYGNSYDTIGNPAGSGPLPGSYPDVLAATPGSLNIRPSSFLPDIFGTFWFDDNHYPELTRIDQYSGLSTNIIGSAGQRATANVAGIATQIGANGAQVSYLSPATFTNQWFCVYGSAAHPWSSGPQTYDPLGDGCPATLGRFFPSGTNNTVSDGLGNIYLADGNEQVMRELPLGNAFPATPVGTTTSSTPVTQAIQVHFGGNNPPALGGTVPAGTTMTGNLASSTTFSIATGITDFTINTTTPEWPMGSLITSSVNGYGLNSSSANFGMVAGLPTCTQLGVSPTATGVTDWDCLVYVTFNPTAPGFRESQLVVTTANGSKYNFALTGIGVGGQLAVDGGTPAPVPATGLGTVPAVAVASSGTVYMADPANNRIVVEPSGGGAQNQTAIGPTLNFPACPTNPVLGVQCGVTPATLSGPMGVALDAANNVYISDTGNNRIVEVNQITGVATVLGNYVWVPGNPATAPPQYKFNHPRGLAVDAFNNVYVADTGNAAVVEITANIALGGAVPLLAYPGAPKFINPVAVAVDSQNNIYVADTQNATGQIVELPPGGGDLITVPNSQFPSVRGSSLTNPNGVAVDGAGNVYASDSATNSVVEFPAGSGAHAAPFTLNFPGLNSPAGLALDAAGNLYVADAGNKQVVVDNRQNPTVNFGTVPQFQTNVATVPLTVTNIGTQPVSLAATFASITPNTAFTITNNSCNSAAMGGNTIPAGVTCTLSAAFNPTADGGQAANVTINPLPGQAATQTVSLIANGVQPLANIVLSAAYSTGTTPTAGATATITATVTQPHIAGNTPAGSVLFSYTVQGDGTTGQQTVNLSGAGGTATASFVLPTLLQGRRYTINASYSSTDSQNTSSTATPLVLYVPGVAVTVTATSVSFTYGQAVPAITGTVTGITDPTVTYKFTSAATPSTPVGQYPVLVVFSGGSYLNYGFPPAVTSTGAPAVVTENPAPLSYKIPNFTAQYGAPAISYGVNGVITGGVNSDKFSATFVPPDSSVLNVGTYSVVPTVTSNHIGNYTVTAPNASLTITTAPSSIGVGAAQSQVLNTPAAVATATIALNVSTLVPAGKGIPTGTVTVTDNFTPITLTAPGTGAPAAPVNTVLPLVAGFATYTPTNTNPGTHTYTFSYSGDTNFQCSVTGQAAVGNCATGGTTATKLLVDYPDFTVTSATGVINIIPGVVPSGNGLPPAANQSAAAPETAIISIGGVLGFAGNVAISCQTQNPSYVSCSMTPPLVTLTATGAGVTTASILSVSTPATLPLGFFSEVRTSMSKTVLAFLPFGVLAFCVRRRRRLSQVLWMLLAIAAVGAGMQGCGGNQVSFYTPVPTGPQTVTITAAFTGNAALGIPAETRSFVVPISIN